MTLSISKEERNGEYKAYLKEETTSCLLDNHRVTQRDSLCSQTEYLLMEIIEAL